MLTQKSRILLVILTIIGLSACDAVPLLDNLGSKSKATADKISDTSPVLATVNGRPITQNLYDAFMQQRSRRQPSTGTAEERQQILEELIKMDLVVQEAQKQQLSQRPDIAGQLEMQYRNILVGTYIQEYFQKNDVTDAQVKVQYDEQIGSLPSKEYKARHILLENEDDARAVIAELETGTDFSELAKQKSTGPTAPRGGDLGWFPPAQMVAPFSQAVMAMKKGDYSKEPVKTQFGWHVILFEDERDATPPSFENMLPRLKAQMQAKSLQEYIDGLMAGAQIQKNALPPPPAEHAVTGEEPTTP